MFVWKKIFLRAFEILFQNHELPASQLALPRYQDLGIPATSYS